MTEERASLTSDDLVRVRVKCAECKGTGVGPGMGEPMCGQCLRVFEDNDPTPAPHLLPCGHGLNQRAYTGTACLCCDGGWVEQWVSVAALLRLVPPAQPARKPRRRSPAKRTK